LKIFFRIKGNANTELRKSIRKPISQRCELCTEGGGYILNTFSKTDKW